MADLCTDNRFELIEKFKKKLIESTNIETSPEEMNVLDNILFRFWQMGWLDKLELPPAQPDVPDTNVGDTISRQAAVDALKGMAVPLYKDPACEDIWERDRTLDNAIDAIRGLPSAQPEQRYTEEELRVFQHGISLSLLSKRSAQHWRYDEDTATEIEFLERLYEKVGADMRGEQDE